MTQAEPVKRTPSVVLNSLFGPVLIRAPAALKRFECRIKEDEKDCTRAAVMVWMSGDGKFSDLPVCREHFWNLMDKAAPLK
jgi:hypothetical protein